MQILRKKFILSVYVPGHINPESFSHLFYYTPQTRYALLCPSFWVQTVSRYIKEITEYFLYFSRSNIYAEVLVIKYEGNLYQSVRIFIFNS